MGMKLAFLCFDAFGHVNPTLAMTAELVRRGAEITYYVPEAFTELVASTGAKAVSYESIFVAHARQESHSTPAQMMASFPLRLFEEAEHVLPGLLEHLQADRPDVLLYDDMCLAGRFAAQLLRLPAIALSPSYASNDHFALRTQGPEVPSDHPQRVALAEHIAAFRAKYDLPVGGYPELLLHAEELNLVFLTRAYQPLGDTFDERFAFVGPQLAARPPLATPPLPKGVEPLLFVSLGTVFNDWPEFFRMVIKAFADQPWRVAMAIGDRVTPDLLGQVPAHIAIAPYLPQLEILPQAAVFLTHGGMNSVQEAISFGVPMVVLPQMTEQAQSARRVAELGLGKAFLDKAEVTPEALLHAVHELVADPGYKTRVQAFSKHTQESGGFLRSADLVEAYAAKVKNQQRA